MGFQARPKKAKPQTSVPTNEAIHVHPRAAPKDLEVRAFIDFRPAPHISSNPLQAG